MALVAVATATLGLSSWPTGSESTEVAGGAEPHRVRPAAPSRTHRSPETLAVCYAGAAESLDVDLHDDLAELRVMRRHVDRIVAQMRAAR